MFHSLVVDDSKEKRMKVVEAVKDASLGVPVIDLAHAHEAIRYIAEHAREIIVAIFDHTFSGELITGLDLIEALRTLNADALIYLVTSHPLKSEEYRRRESEAMKRGATGVFSTNMRPYDGFDWLYMELRDKLPELVEKFGLGKGL